MKQVAFALIMSFAICSGVLMIVAVTRTEFLPGGQQHHERSLRSNFCTASRYSIAVGNDSRR